MKKCVRKAAAAVMIGALGLSMLSGCGSKEIDGTAIVATVDGEQIPMSVVSLLARYQQVKVANMYSGMMGYDTNEFWDNVQENGETYGEQTVREAAVDVEQMYILRAHAAEYNVTITDEEQQAITEAAQTFVEDNGEEVMQKLAATQEDVELFLELSTYQTKMHDAIAAEADPNVTDEEAQQTTLTYTRVEYGEDATDEEKAEAQETAQEILDQVLATADADMEEIAEGIDEDSITINIHFSTNDEEDDTVDDFLKEAVSGLADGEVNSSLIEGNESYYVVRLDAEFDQDATDTRKISIVNEREEELYNDTVDGWMEEASIELDEDVLSTLTMTSTEVYQEMQMGNTAEEEAGADAAETEEETDTSAETEAADETDETSAETDAAAETDGTAAETTETEAAETETSAESEAAAETEAPAEAE
ncbi:MAG TPA: peptidyl-prolyl cis-trans isomerase [Candidatus Blautia gallistercoris]|uniref:Peptidyl-prolyl cis-trans isomerase n=1 Tax=Candidatus Blautia gallistercoris TaxID=2838490 RepID=A0A9D2B2W1_9FIRM|nr:peptidyl-prolyl cis-trans isomerase [Candidatus Blautia gallistercoris]